jgi:protein arginine N-methyltransferase 1
MSGTEAANATGVIASSADRMVGAEHAEVRYFTRYDLQGYDFGS